MRFDSDGEGVQASDLPLLPPGSGGGGSGSGSSGSGSNGGTATAAGRDKAALTDVDLLEWGILRLGSLCDALPPVKWTGQ